MEKRVRMRDLNKQEWLLIIMISILTFILVYSPHLNYHYPMHIDEWHHLGQAIKLYEGGYSWGWGATEFGFHAFLAGLSLFVDILKNYQYFAAIWAVVTGLILFWVVYKKSEGEFEIALFAMIFFASIKSNINLLGLWFFTPLSFVVPFIFLYVYFFTEGVERENRKYLLISLGLMLLVIFIHSISLLFAIPFLLIYCIIRWKKVLKQWKIFSVFFAVPLVGILFYSFILKMNFINAFIEIIRFMEFKYGWGVSEQDNSFFEIYSLIGYAFALIGTWVLLFKKKIGGSQAYLLWPVCVLAMIFVFRIWDVSYLSPYQRNMYYFVLTMPLLSAFGLGWLIEMINGVIDSVVNGIDRKEMYKGILMVVVIFGMLVLIFVSYFNIPDGFKPYAVADDGGFQALEFLKGLPQGTVMAPVSISSAMFPVSRKNPVAMMFSYGDRAQVEKFFAAKDCMNMTSILRENNANYVLFKNNETSTNGGAGCNWTNLYNEGNYTIYKFK